MSKSVKILAFLCLLLTTSAKSQEINFGSYYSYTASLIELNPASSLEFGTLIQGLTPISIDLAEAKILAIEGVKYLDIIVTITATDLLNTDIGCSGDCSIPFTLEAGYANLGSENIGQVTPMIVSSNIATAQFPILRRTGGAPGPPPTPVYEGFDPSIFNETAYIYIYGSLIVGSANAGSYEGTINVSVSYD